MHADKRFFSNEEETKRVPIVTGLLCHVKIYKRDRLARARSPQFELIRTLPTIQLLPPRISFHFDSSCCYSTPLSLTPPFSGTYSQLLQCTPNTANTPLSAIFHAVFPGLLLFSRVSASICVF